MIPVREFSSAAEVIANARAVKAKFWAYDRHVAYPPEVVAKQLPGVPDPEMQKAREVRMFCCLFAAGIRQAMAEDLEAVKRRAMARAQFVSYRNMVEFVVGYTGYSLQEIAADRRTANVVAVRQCLMWCLKEFTQQSLPSIGRFLYRDHTSVLHACRKIEAVVKSEGINVSRADWPVTVRAVLDLYRECWERKPPPIKVRKERKPIEQPKVPYTGSKNESRSSPYWSEHEDSLLTTYRGQYKCPYGHIAELLDRQTGISRTEEAVKKRWQLLMEKQRRGL